MEPITASPAVLGAKPKDPVTPMSLEEMTDSPVPHSVRDTTKVEQAPARIETSSQSQMQRWWQESISKSMGVNGYKNVAVLLVKWQKEVDQLRVDQEVSELKSIFADKYGYATRAVELSRRNPQMQLTNAISGFILEHDDPQNLLIVYYAGHGIFHDEEKLLEIANTDDPVEADDMLTKVFWNEAQRALSIYATGDVLAIMDCCFASNLMVRGGHKVSSREFEMLAASSIDKPTEAPGAKSFTRALINCLNALAEQEGGFDTNELSQAIDQVRTRTPCRLWNVLQGSRRHIRLGPRKTQQEEPQAPPEPVWSFDGPGGLLSLQFVIKDNELSKDMIERLTHRLPEAFEQSQVPLRNIRWLDFDRPKTIPGLAAIIMNTQKFNKRRKTQGAASSGDLTPLNAAVKRRSPDSPFMKVIGKVLDSDYQASGDESTG